MLSVFITLSLLCQTLGQFVQFAPGSSSLHFMNLNEFSSSQESPDGI